MSELRVSGKQRSAADHYCTLRGVMPSLAWILERWNPGILESWNPGILESWNPGILESWNPGILESWNPGILNPRWFWFYGNRKSFHIKHFMLYHKGDSLCSEYGKTIKSLGRDVTVKEGYAAPYDQLPAQRPMSSLR
jgi:hypothetical protein